jgi:hypothetical protein
MYCREIAKRLYVQLSPVDAFAARARLRAIGATVATASDMNAPLRCVSLRKDLDASHARFGEWRQIDEDLLGYGPTFLSRKLQFSGE